MKPNMRSERSQLLNLLTGKILDIGCNEGDFHKRVIRYGEVYGLDKEITNYKENVIKGDSHFLPFKDESFDSIVAGEIIEHLTNPERFLKDVRRALKKGGRLLISTPNIHSLRYVRQMILGGKTLSDYPEHIYAWDLILFRRFIEKVAKMTIIECGYADPEGTNKLAILVHKLKPQFSAFLYVVAERT